MITNYVQLTAVTRIRTAVNIFGPIAEFTTDAAAPYAVLQTMQIAKPLNLNFVGVLKINIFTGTQARLRNFASAPREFMDIPAIIILLGE